MKVMSIGGCCADLAFLDKNVRVPGPVDNWLALYGLRSAFGLFTDFGDQIKRGWVEKKPGRVDFGGDSDTDFSYKEYVCRHLNMEDPRIVENVLNRYSSFLEHWKRVKTEPDCYFSYVLTSKDRVKSNGKWVLSASTVDALKKTDGFFPLDKLIVVGTPLVKLRSGFSFYIDVVPKWINYVNVSDVKYLYLTDLEGKLGPQKQFNRYMEKLKSGKQDKNRVVCCEEQDDWED